MKSGNLKFLEPSGPLQACNGTALSSYIYNSLFKQNFVKRMPADYKANFYKNSCNLYVNARYEDINNKHGSAGLLFLKLLDSKNQYTRGYIYEIMNGGR
jgi:hypothetical protein